MIFTVLIRASPENPRKIAVQWVGGTFEECRKKIFEFYGKERVISIIYEPSKNDFS